MAAGDVFAGVASVAAAGNLDIQPASGSEATVHNVYYAGAVEFHAYDGTNDLTWDSDSTSGARLGMVTHVTHTQWLRVHNPGASAVLVAYDGVYTK